MRISAVLLLVVAIAGCSGEGPNTETSTQKGCQTTVQVFIDLGASEQRERRVGQILGDHHLVVDSTFHSRDEAYREFKKLYRKEPEIYEAKSPEDFPARYEVTLSSSSAIDEFQRTFVDATTGVDRLVPAGCATESPS